MSGNLTNRELAARPKAFAAEICAANPDFLSPSLQHCQLRITQLKLNLVQAPQFHTNIASRFFWPHKISHFDVIQLHLRRADWLIRS
jgi:hypothetical protein